MKDKIRNKYGKLRKIFICKKIKDKEEEKCMNLKCSLQINHNVATHLCRYRGFA